LGGFQKLMNYLKAVGSFMDGAGLKEVIVAAEILKEGNANKFLSGKNMYQALMLKVSDVFVLMNYLSFALWLTIAATIASVLFL
jgi:hypothetical protein